MVCYKDKLINAIEGEIISLNPGVSWQIVIIPHHLYGPPKEEVAFQTQILVDLFDGSGGANELEVLVQHPLTIIADSSIEVRLEALKETYRWQNLVQCLQASNLDRITVSMPELLQHAEQILDEILNQTAIDAQLVRTPGNVLLKFESFRGHVQKKGLEVHADFALCLKNGRHCGGLCLRVPDGKFISSSISTYNL
jgi:hypothetical protein